MPHLVATLIYLSQIYSYYIRGDRSPLNRETLSVSIVVLFHYFSRLNQETNISNFIHLKLRITAKGRHKLQVSEF